MVKKCDTCQHNQVSNAKEPLINIEATNPEEVYPPAADMEPADNSGFLADCRRKIPRICFVERSSGLVYACMESGVMQWVDHDILQRILNDDENRAALLAMVGW